MELSIKWNYLATILIILIRKSSSLVPLTDCFEEVTRARVFDVFKQSTSGFFGDVRWFDLEGTSHRIYIRTRHAPAPNATYPCGPGGIRFRHSTGTTVFPVDPSCTMCFTRFSYHASNLMYRSGVKAEFRCYRELPENDKCKKGNSMLMTANVTGPNYELLGGGLHCSNAIARATPVSIKGAAPQIVSWQDNFNQKHTIVFNASQRYTRAMYPCYRSVNFKASEDTKITTDTHVARQSLDFKCNWCLTYFGFNPTANNLNIYTECFSDPTPSHVGGRQYAWIKDEMTRGITIEDMVRRWGVETIGYNTKKRCFQSAAVNASGRLIYDSLVILLTASCLFLFSA